MRAARDLTAEDFTNVVQSGDLNGLLGNFARERLREFESGVAAGYGKLDADDLALYRAVVASNSVDEARDVLRNMTDIARDATELINTTNEFTAAKITAATTQQRAELESAKLTTAIAEQRAIQTQHETRSQEAAVAAEVARRLDERVQRDLDPRLQEASKLKVAAEEKLRQAETRFEQAQTLRNSADDLIDRMERRGAGSKQRRVDKVEDQDRREMRQRKSLQHDLELATIKTKLQQERHQQRVDRALLRRRLAGASDPASARLRRNQIDQERALERIRDELRSFTNETQRIGYARSEIETHLKAVAEQYGEDSDEYGTAEAQADTFIRRLQDGESEP